MPVSSASSSAMSFRAPEISELLPDENGMVVDDHIQFSVKGTNVHIRKQVSDSSEEIEALFSNEENRCAGKFSEAKKENMRDAYAGKDMIFYALYDPDLIVPEPALYYIQLLPNALAYKDFESVNEDFEMCAAGSFKLQTMSQKWLVFSNDACGGVSESCEEFEQIVEPSITLR